MAIFENLKHLSPDERARIHERARLAEAVMLDLLELVDPIKSTYLYECEVLQLRGGCDAARYFALCAEGEEARCTASAS